MSTQQRTDAEIRELHEIARNEASRRLTLSGGHAVDDVASAAMLDFLRYEEENVVNNPGGLIRLIARRGAFKVRDDWERVRDGDRPVADDHRDEVDNEIDGAGLGDSHFVPVGQELQPLDALISERERELVRCAIAQLDDDDRRIVELTYLDDPRLKAPAVAERLGIAPGTVRNKLMRIRRELAEMLAEDPDLDEWAEAQAHLRVVRSNRTSTVAGQPASQPSASAPRSRSNPR